ncbi:MAG: tetratricopeptide repeat protein [Anaerolineales bacterium]
MLRNTLRTIAVLTLLLSAIFIPFLASGYSEIKQAETATSYPEVARHYLIAAKRLPWRPDLYELAGTAYYHARDYVQAEVGYQKAFERNALSPSGWVAWGDVLYLNQEPEHAFEIWKDGLKQSEPSTQLYSRLAKVYQEQNDYISAAENLQRFVAANPQDAPAHYRLGLLLTFTDSNVAASELLNASQLDPEFDPAVQTLRTALNLATINDSASERSVIIGRGLGLVNEWQLALAAFQSAVQVDEKNAEAWAWLGEAKQQTGGKDALTYLDRALTINPNSPTVRSLRGLYFQRVGNYRDALTESQAAARLDIKNPAMFVSLGNAYAMTGDLILGLQSYQYAASLAPEDTTYWTLLAAFCAQNNVNVSDVGIPAAQKAIALSKNDPTALDVLGWNYLLMRRYIEAESALKQALENDLNYAPAHVHLATVYLQKNDRVAAYDHLIQARNLGSTEAEAALNQYFP